MRLNIHYKITLIFVIISGIILLGVFFYIGNILREYTTHRIKANISKQLEFCKSYLAESSFGSLSGYGLDRIADKIGHDLDLRVTIIGLDGVVYGDSQINIDELPAVENHLFRPEVQKAIQSGFGESRRFSTTIKDDFLYMAALHNQDDDSIIIRLSIPLSEIRQLLGRLRHTLAYSLLAAFILSGLVSYLASFFISRPIKKISGFARNIAQGDYRRKILVRSNDEIGDLAATVNYMATQVERRIEEVSHSKSRLEAVFASMFEGVIVVDAAGLIILMNQALKKFFGIKEDPLGKRPIELIRNLQIQEMVDDTVNLHKEHISREISVMLEEEKNLSVHVAPIKRNGKIEGAVLVFHDMTNLRKLEKIRQDFVANVSHELRTPISSIKGYAETLLDGALYDKENAEDFIKIILSDADRLASLIDDLLNLSKIESGKLELEYRRYRFFPIVEKVRESLKKTIAEKSISLKIEIPENLPEILVDETRIKQVLLNLIDNAVKYNRTGGDIIISARAIKDFIQVNISDTGIGIPEKDLPRLFERFYRVDKARSRELGGTGLGLSIVKHILQAHNGEISVSSEEGRGTTFTFTLPRSLSK